MNNMRAVMESVRHVKTVFVVMQMLERIPGMTVTQSTVILETVMVLVPVLFTLVVNKVIVPLVNIVLIVIRNVNPQQLVGVITFTDVSVQT